MSNIHRASYPLRMGEDLEVFVADVVDKSGRSKNAVLKACIQIAKENKNRLFEKTGVENAAAR